MTESPLYKYMAEKALADLRSGGTVSPDLVTIFNSKKAQDVLRRFLKEEQVTEDLGLLSNLAEHGHLPIRNFAISTLRVWKEDPEVKSLLFHLWDVHEDVSTRLNLLWRLLDYEDLSPTFRERLYTFVLDNWNAFLNLQQEFMGEGNPTTVLERVEERIKDKNFPKTKRWAYLCSAMASDDGPGIIRLIDRYEGKEGSFDRTVADELRKRCEEKFGSHDIFASILKGIRKASLSKCDLRIWELLRSSQFFPMDERNICAAQHEIRCHFIEHKLAGTTVERWFNGLIEEFKSRSLLLQAGQSPDAVDHSLSDQCLHAWRWYAKCAKSQWDHIEHELVVKKDSEALLRDVMNGTMLQSIAAEEWAERFACMYRIASSDSKDDWFRGTFADPRVARLPIPCRSVWSETLISSLPRAMVRVKGDTNRKEKIHKSGSDFTRLLCEQLRIIQWEVMPRDRTEEILNKRFRQVPKVERYLGEPGLISGELHNSLALSAWQQVCNDFSTLSGRTEKLLLKSELKEYVINNINNISKNFMDYIRVSPEDEETLNMRYGDFVRYVTEESSLHGGEGSASGTRLIVVEDGELTFFCLLWRLRTAIALYQPEIVSSWVVGNENVRLSGAHDSEFHLWPDDDMGNFLVRLGLLCPTERNIWIPTDRLRSFNYWYLRYHRLCRKLVEGGKFSNRAEFIHALSECLPVRTLAKLKEDESKNAEHLLLKMFLILSSTTVAKNILNIISTEYFTSPKEYFEKIFGCLYGVTLRDEFMKDFEFNKVVGEFFEEFDNKNFLQWVLSRQEENPKPGVEVKDPGYDMALFQLSRTCYLPLEDLVRCYQPYQTHLLMMPYDFRYPDEIEKEIYRKLHIPENHAVPSAVAFATVIGSIGIRRPECAVGRRCDTTMRYMPDWLHTYWSGFQAVSSAVIVRSYEEMEGEISSHFTLRSEYVRQGHEVKKVIDCIRHSSPKPVLDLVRAYYYGVIIDKQLIEKDPLALPEDYIMEKSEYFGDFLNRMMIFAGRIKVLINIAGENISQYDDMTKIDQKAANFIRHIIISDKLKGRKIAHTPMKTDIFYTRAVYSSMVVASISNILQYTKASDKIMVDLVGTADKEGIIFNNPLHNDFINTATMSNKFGGTELALDTYKRRFQEGNISNIKIVFGPSSNKKQFLTVIPSPISIFEK